MLEKINLLEPTEKEIDVHNKIPQTAKITIKYKDDYLLDKAYCYFQKVLYCEDIINFNEVDNGNLFTISFDSYDDKMLKEAVNKISDELKKLSLKHSVLIS